jgi:hypothetical protein
VLTVNAHARAPVAWTVAVSVLMVNAAQSAAAKVTINRGDLVFSPPLLLTKNCFDNWFKKCFNK